MLAESCQCLKRSILPLVVTIVFQEPRSQALCCSLLHCQRRFFPQRETPIHATEQFPTLSPFKDVDIHRVQRNDSVDVDGLPLTISSGAADTLGHRLAIRMVGVGPEGAEKDDVVRIGEISIREHVSELHASE